MVVDRYFLRQFDVNWKKFFLITTNSFVIIFFLLIFICNIVMPGQPFIFEQYPVLIGLFNGSRTTSYFAIHGYFFIILSTISLLLNTFIACWLVKDKIGNSFCSFRKSIICSLILFWLLFILSIVFTFCHHFAIEYIDKNYLNLIFNYKFISTNTIDVNYSSGGITYIVLYSLSIPLQLFYLIKLFFVRS